MWRHTFEKKCPSKNYFCRRVLRTPDCYEITNIKNGVLAGTSANVARKRSRRPWVTSIVEDRHVTVSNKKK